MSCVCIQDALSWAVHKITGQSARIDAEILLMYVLKKKRAFLYAYPELILSQAQYVYFQELIDLRKLGHPVAYLTGEREFWSIKLSVTPDTLIPRAESECIIEVILEQFDKNTRLKVLELGTGSGALACALASDRSEWTIVSCDISLNALKVAQQNADHLNLGNIQFIHSNWFSSLVKTQKFDLILSNPPYLASDDPHLTHGDLRFEPKNALISGPSGLEDLEHIIQHSHEYLNDGGLLVLEHGFTQRNAVMNLLDQTGYNQLQCWPDIQGHDRVTGGYYSAE